ncbi:MAG: hypothetical protein IT329_19870 [Caldilineaceae bacterium]|nr:hypothetical protein [Caldilineaceae bacterium]
MIDDPSYRSFLVRLWHAPEASEAAWRGEVEYIQSGSVVTVFSLEEVFRLILHTAAGVAAPDQSSYPGQPISDSSYDGETVE